MSMRWMLMFLFCLACPAMAIVFPNDPRAVIDVKRDCGAKGDGVADDTAALQSAIERIWEPPHSRTIYLPKGNLSNHSAAVGHLYQERGSTVWVRQYNTERGPAKVGVNTRNDGGQLWVLGMKTEAASTKLATLNGGRSEILGVHNYNTSGVKDETPFFRVEDSSLFVAGYREICFGGAWWKTTVLSTTKGQESRQGSKPWQTWSILRAGQ